jgi:hypothetical protein
MLVRLDAKVEARNEKVLKSGTYAKIVPGLPRTRFNIAPPLISTRSTKESNQ